MRDTRLALADKSPAPAPPENPRKSSDLARQIVLAMELPFIPIVSVLIAGGAGYLLDKWWHTVPLMSLLLGVLGFAAGVREILRRISKEDS